MARKKTNYKQLTDSELQKIQALYLSGAKPQKISHDLKIDVNVIYNWVRNNKKAPVKKQINSKIQDLLAGEIFRQGAEELADLQKTNKMLHQAVRLELEKYETTKDLQALTTAFKNIFGISQTIEGRPSEIIEETSINIAFSPDEKEKYLEWRNEIKKS